MQIARRSIITLVVALGLHAQQQQPPGSMDGQVTNSLTGEPVSNATLHLIPLRYMRGGTNSSPQTSSQAEGAFHFDSVTAGTYVITAARSGFVSNELNSKSAIVTVSPGQAVTGVAVTLTPEGSLGGRIEEDDGTAVPGALVEALATVTARGRTSLRLYSNTHSDKDGKFLLNGLPPNSYYILADPPDTPQKASKDGALVRTVYPRSLDIDGASALPVTAGQSLPGISLHMRRTNTFHIRGKIADPSGDTVGAKLRLLLFPRGSVDSLVLARKVDVSPSNTFDIGGLTSGVYTLRLTGAPRSIGRSRALLAREDVDLGGANLNGVVLTVMPPLSVTGQVHAEGGTNGALPQVSVTARPQEDLNHSSFGAAQSTGDGSLTFSPIDPGLYVFKAFVGTPGWYVKSLTLNQQDILNKQVDLTESSTARIEVTLSQGAGEVDGTVQTDVVSGVAVILVPETIGPDGSGVLFNYVARDQRFSVRTVAPGKYRAFAAQQPDPNLWQNPEFIKSIENEGIPVELEENGHQQVTLPLLSLEQIEQAAARLGLQVQ